MCGISGIISLNNDPLNYEQLKFMTNELSNRGPDGEGYLVTNNDVFGASLANKSRYLSMNTLQNKQHLGFGHRRLSITDLSSKASQPMTDVNKRYWIVFNGQIYNHAELRKELEAKGYKFFSDHSDTEVILNGYSCWGINCLNHFNGMWAFCLWDSIENAIFISRDRAGKQPLYYTIADNKFYFASELNAILTNKNIARELDEKAIYDYLTYTFVPSPNTMFKGIYKVPAAHYFLFKPGDKIEAKKYWDPLSIKPVTAISEKEIIESLKNKLFESTQLRMVADVNVGMLLSGGLDSSINLACMNAYSPGPVKTYTVGFENNKNYKNEFGYAKKVASFLKAELNEVIVDEKQFFDFLPQMAYLQDEPIADAANIPLYFVSKAAREDNTRVLLSGEGADELFIGYEHWRLIYEFEKVMRNKPKLASILDYAHKRSAFRNRGAHYQMWIYKIKNHWPVFWSGTELRTEENKQEILQPDFLKKIGNYNSFLPLTDLHNSVLSQKPYDAFRWMTTTDLQNRLPDFLLARLDRMMMSASVEGRNPFLDVNLIEFVLSIPPELKVRQKTEKYLLKKAFEGILPKEIINRSKDSFTVPLNELFNANRVKGYSEVINKFNSATGIFRKDYLKQLELPVNIKEFWNILNLSLWHEKHQ
jgi:asparagine synthase (glutamine-hydrolysing)